MSTLIDLTNGQANERKELRRIKEARKSEKPLAQTARAKLEFELKVEQEARAKREFEFRVEQDTRAKREFEFRVEQEARAHEFQMAQMALQKQMLHFFEQQEERENK